MQRSITLAVFCFLVIAFCCARPPAVSADAVPAAPEAPVKKKTAEQKMEGSVPLRLLAEAEEFTVNKPGWRVMPYRENYFASTFAITFLSRMACLSAPEQMPIGKQAMATQTITLPENGEFKVLARYEQPLDYSAEFTVEVEQDGKVVYSNQFGALNDPKIWALNLHKRVPMERYWWGGTDNIVWQQVDAVKLHKGVASLRLIAGAQMDGDKPRVNAARRNVDVVCLTNDAVGMEAQKRTRHLEFDGWLTQAGDLLVKITNPQQNDSPCAPKLGPCEQHSPFDSHVRDWSTTSVYRQGRVDPLVHYQYAGPHISAIDPALLSPMLDSLSIPAVVPADLMLAPGETSGWIPMGGILDSLNHCVWAPYANFKFQNGNNVGLDLQFAVPDGRGGVTAIRTVRVKDDLLLIPANVRTNPNIRTRLETLTSLTDYVSKLPDRGPVPKRFPIFGILDYSGAKSDAGDVGQQANKLALALGSNTLVASPGSWAVKLGAKPARTQILANYSTLEAIKKVTDDAVKAGTDGLIRIICFSDEVNIVPVRPTRGLEETFNKKFETYLKAQGGADVPAGTAITDDPKSPWYYYAQVYMLDQGIEKFAKVTESVNQIFKGEVLTGANVAPLANFMVSETQFIRPFKNKAMTLGWSEDYTWQAPEFSDQITGYTVTAFRAGAKYHDTPIMMYIMPHSPGNTPASFRRSFYTAVAHGTTLVNYFCATPLSVGGTENYIDTDDLPMWKAVHDTTHEAGQFEDYVLDGRVEKAKVALLLSSVDEIITGDNNMRSGIHNLERKGIYYALRHAQVPVDMLSEDDLLDGHADGYSVIYVTQQFLHSKAIKALTKFAEGGGTVVGLCGGGMYDEYQHLNPEAEKLWGASGPAITKDEKMMMILAKQDLPRYKPADTALLEAGGLDVPVLAWKQPLKLLTGDSKAGHASVAATFADGSAAAIENPVGSGRAVLFGFLPATAYMKSALPVRPMDRSSTDAGYDHFCPVDMDVKLRAALVDAFLPSGFRRPVVVSQNGVEKAAPLIVGTDAKTNSEPHTQKSIVETTRIITKDKNGQITKMAVTLVNFTGNPIADLHVALADVPAPKSIKSVEKGSQKFTTEGGGVRLNLPLDVADMLLIDF
jgi:hypothetical protein